MDSTSIDDVAFLVRSEHRAEILDRLTRRDWTRRELRDATGISQPTLGRILSGFEERGWVADNGRTNGREYTLTPLGEFLADDFMTLLDTTQTIRKLRGAVEHLPFDEMAFDNALLMETTITIAQPDDTLAHMRRQDALAEESDYVRTLCSSFSPAAIEAQRDRILNGDNTGEAIVAGDALDRLTDDDELAELLGDIIASDKTTFYRYDGPMPIMLSEFDEKVGIIPIGDDGMPCGVFIESDHEEIKAWVVDTLDAYQERATELMTGELME